MPRMGDLAATDVYNAFDVPVEQSTNVGWANRMGEILTARPTYDEQTVLYPTASPLVNITEGDIGRATEAALGGMTVTPKGIRAYHSSPHDFDKFDLAKIGTGEGAQAYGHGLYFAESPAVSGQGGQYWQQFVEKFPRPEVTAAGYLQQAGFDRAKAIEMLRTQQEQVAPLYKNRPSTSPKTPFDEAIDLLKSDKPIIGPRTYEVDINADPAHMLDWDKALTQQSKTVQEALGITPEVQDALMMHNKNPRPRSFYDPELWQRMKLLDDDLRGSTIAGNDAAKSAALREAGIPGIKYLDQGSRPAFAPSIVIDDGKYLVYAGQKTGVKPNEYSTLEAALAAKAEAEAAQKAAQTSNYVIFDPGIIDIMKKYGIAGAAPVGMGALAAQDTYRE